MTNAPATTIGMSHAMPRIAAAPVRVCFVIDRLSRAGTEMQLLALIRTLDRSRVQPYLVLLDGDDVSRELEPLNCTVVRLCVKSFASLRAVAAAGRFVRFLRREQIDIVQAYFLDSIYFAVPLARLACVKAVLRVRNNLGYWLNRRHRLLNRLMARLTHRTLTNSDEGRAALVIEGVPADRIAVLENGVDVDRFESLPLPDLSRTPARIGVVANLRPVKNLPSLIRAVARLRERGLQVLVEVAGEGEQRRQLESLISECKLTGSIRLLGNVADVPAFLGSQDIAVLCSRSEGMSNALLEYMAAGRAIVATRVGAAQKIIRDSVEGILIPSEDDEALAQALARLITEPDLARRLGTAARQRAIESFSRDAMRRRFEDMYQDLFCRFAKR